MLLAVTGYFISQRVGITESIGGVFIEGRVGIGPALFVYRQLQGSLPHAHLRFCKGATGEENSSKHMPRINSMFTAELWRSQRANRNVILSIADVLIVIFGGPESVRRLTSRRAVKREAFHNAIDNSIL